MRLERYYGTPVTLSELVGHYEFNKIDAKGFEDLLKAYTSEVRRKVAEKKKTSKSMLWFMVGILLFNLLFVFHGPIGYNNLFTSFLCGTLFSIIMVLLARNRHANNQHLEK